jgi:hypothetical protein
VIFLTEAGASLAGHVTQTERTPSSRMLPTVIGEEFGWWRYGVSRRKCYGSRQRTVHAILAVFDRPKTVAAIGDHCCLQFKYHHGTGEKLSDSKTGGNWRTSGATWSASRGIEQPRLQTSGRHEQGANFIGVERDDAGPADAAIQGLSVAEMRKAEPGRS